LQKNELTFEVYLAEEKDGVDRRVDRRMRARRFDHIRRVDQLISVDDDVLVLAPGLFDSSHAVHVFSFISKAFSFFSLVLLQK
jgi:hypothetical protein